MPVWIIETPVVVGVISLLVVLEGALLRRKTESEAHGLTVPESTRAMLRTDVDDQKDQARELKKQTNEAEKEKRLAWEKYSSTLSHIRLLGSIITGNVRALTSSGLTAHIVPAPLDNIRDDM